MTWLTEAHLEGDTNLVYEILTLRWLCTLREEHPVNFLDFFHGWLGIRFHCQRVYWTSLLMHIDYDNHSPSPAGHGGTDTELWTDAISVAYWATSTSELCHAPGKTYQLAEIFFFVARYRSNKRVILTTFFKASQCIG